MDSVADCVSLLSHCCSLANDIFNGNCSNFENLGLFTRAYPDLVGCFSGHFMFKNRVWKGRQYHMPINILSFDLAERVC